MRRDWEKENEEYILSQPALSSLKIMILKFYKNEW